VFNTELKEFIEIYLYKLVM